MMPVLVVAQDNRYVIYSSRSCLFLDVVRDPPGLINCCCWFSFISTNGFSTDHATQQHAYLDLLQ